MTPKPQLKQYLGDSVYADFDGWQIQLTTENGDDPSNVIFLEPNTLKAFDAYREWLKKQLYQEKGSQ